MQTTVRRAYKFRCYPTAQQRDELLRTFGCVRKVYNLALEARTIAWYRDQRRVTYAQTSAMLTEWKRSPDLAFLAEVSSVPLQQALRNLQSAFANFWAKNARYPKFKSRRKSRQSAQYTRTAFSYRSGRLKLAKMSQPLPVVWSRVIPDGAEPSSVTVSRDRAGRWFVSLLVEAAVEPLAPASGAVGVDAGLSALLTLSDGEKIANPRYERRDRKRLASAQRALARKEKGSNNRDKARTRVARVHARITDRRKDFLHKLTTRLVRENQTIVIEDLNVAGMIRNRSLARAISDASWSSFRSMLAYKAEWYGREVIAIDRWFPSSKLCSSCGSIRESLPLNIRDWSCPCGAQHDRDINAARNILAAGLAAAACGDGVRPNSAKAELASVGAPKGKKQEAPKRGDANDKHAREGQ